MCNMTVYLKEAICVSMFTIHIIYKQFDSQHLQVGRVREGGGGQVAQAVPRQHQVVQAPQPAQRLAVQRRDLVTGQVTAGVATIQYDAPQPTVVD